MASARISVGGIEIAVEDEDREFEPLLEGAFKALLDVLEKCGPVEADDEEDEEHG